MNILLATHNYYPYKIGGTEVYVANLAAFLKEKSHKVSIIAAVDDDAFLTEIISYDDENLRVCAYHHNDILVYGVQYKEITTRQIYSRQSALHQNSWQKFISANELLKEADILHINGFTPTIGLDLIYSLKQLKGNLKVVSSYHTAISCAKETLLFANTLTEQHQNIDPVADMYSFRLAIPYWLGRFLSRISPGLNLSFLPSLFNIKSLTKLITKSFENLNELTDEWWVYSEGIKNYLIGKGISPDKLIFERHGIADFFIHTQRSSTPPCKFLYSGRTIQSKGFYTLIKAWLKVEKTPERELWITGHPVSANKKTRELIKQVSCREDVIWLGNLDQQAMAKTYSLVNTVIIPSEVYEIGPLVFHEAIASGCRVISSDIGGCRELAHYYSDRSVTFKTGDVNELKDKILTEKIDDNFPAAPTQKILTFNMHFESIMQKSKIYRV